MIGRIYQSITEKKAAGEKSFAVLIDPDKVDRKKIDELVIPDKNNDFECKKFGLWFTDKENPMNYILFYTNTNDIIRRIRNY